MLVQSFPLSVSMSTPSSRCTFYHSNTRVGVVSHRVAFLLSKHHFFSSCTLSDLCSYVAQVMYDRACKFWHFLFNIFQEYHLMSGRQWMQFYAAEQRFFRQMLMAAKVLFPNSQASQLFLAWCSPTDMSPCDKILNYSDNSTPWTHSSIVVSPKHLSLYPLWDSQMRYSCDFHIGANSQPKYVQYNSE